jgi:glycosyltransferase involved in cell wall biosynthesis
LVSIGSLQVSALTRDLTVLVIPDLSHIVLPEFHVAKSRLAAGVLMKRALLNSRTIVAISNHTKADILGFMNGRIPKEKVVVAHIACDEIYTHPPTTADLNRVRRQHRLPQKYILSVGTLEPRKNYEMLVKAFQGCVNEGVEHELVVVGRKGWFYEAIFAVVKNLGLESKVHFLGFVPMRDMPSIYAMADAFVYPSLYEGFGIPPLEAMTCGVPVITSNVTSLPEVAGDAAILIDPRDAHMLSVQLRRLLQDVELRRLHIKAGEEQARKFSWTTFAENVLSAVQH